MFLSDEVLGDVEVTIIIIIVHVNQPLREGGFLSIEV